MKWEKLDPRGCTGSDCASWFTLSGSDANDHQKAPLAGGHGQGTRHGLVKQRCTAKLDLWEETLVHAFPSFCFINPSTLANFRIPVGLQNSCMEAMGPQAPAQACLGLCLLSKELMGLGGGLKGSHLLCRQRITELEQSTLPTWTLQK